MDADRNLLFGVLALQDDLIDAPRFAEICTAWALKKEVPLADLLVERRWITPDEKREVERRLERKLKKHGGDVQASLDSVATNDAHRALAALQDPEIERSLQGLTKEGGYLVLSTLLLPPETRERYTLTRLHARGGIGQVWLARDGELGRDVALKELRPDRSEHLASWERFLKEARITGRLEHPSIVPIYELARRAQDKQPFYTMRFIKGQTLTEAGRDYHRKRAEGKAGPLDRQALLQAFVGVCNAIAFAHSRGVIHRDLKPQNVVLGDFGEVMVLDWGLAKQLDRPDEDADEPPLPTSGAQEETAPGQVLGTPAYMAPEQAAGRPDLFGRPTDVYGLGAILYELLTGQPPFTGSDTHEVLLKVQNDEPARPRQVTAETPPALEAVCLRALAKKPEDRYPSAKDLADEVQRWLADEPVAAYPEPWRVRARRWTKKHRSLMTACLAFLVTAVVALAISALLLNGEKDRTETARKLAVEKAKEANRQAEIARINEANAERQRQRAAANFNKVRAAANNFWLTRFAESTRTSESKSHGKENLLDQVFGDSLAFLESVLGDTDADDLTTLEKARFLTLQGLIYKQLGRPKDAEAAYGKAIAVEPGYAYSYYNLGCDLNDANRYDEAIPLLRKAVELDPKHAFAQNSLGYALKEKGRFDEAIPILRKAIELDPKHAFAHNNLGLALNRKGLHDEAVPIYRKAIELDPNYSWAHANLGWTLNEEKRHDESIPVLRKAIELDPKNSAAHNNLGFALTQTRQYDESIPVSRKAIELDPRNAAAHNTLGFALNEKGLYDESIPVLLKAIELDPKNSAAHNNLGFALNETSRFEEAIPILHKSVQLDPKSVNAFLKLGFALNSSGLYDEAIPILRAAIELDPKSALAYNNLGVAFNEKGLYDEAILVYRKAIELDPKNSLAFGNLGRLLNEVGRFDESISVYRKLLELQPDFAVVHGALCGALRLEGRFSEALGAARRFQELLEPGDPRKESNALLVKELERMVELNGQLPALLRGEVKPADRAEQLRFAEFLQYKKLPVRSARFYEEAFVARPPADEDVKAGQRYNAACAAARAGTGQGKNAGDSEETERIHWRRQTREWLRADLAFWTKHLDPARPESRNEVRATLRHWKWDIDLAAVRDNDDLARLPDIEQVEWRRFWADVDALLGRTDPPK